MLWQLTQMLWVGGLWLLHLGLLPVLGQIGLAPLLINEISSMLNTLLVGFSAACVVSQVLVLVQAKGLVSLWRDIRGQLLLMALYASTMYLVVRMQWPEAEHWLLFSYLVLGFSGLLLVLQPVPGWGGRVREAHPSPVSSLDAVDVRQLLVYAEVLAVNQRHLADDLYQVRLADLAQFGNGSQARFAIEDVELDLDQFVIAQCAFQLG